MIENISGIFLQPSELSKLPTACVNVCVCIQYNDKYDIYMYILCIYTYL